LNKTQLDELDEVTLGYAQEVEEKKRYFCYTRNCSEVYLRGYFSIPCPFFTSQPKFYAYYYYYCYYYLYYHLF